MSIPNLKIFKKQGQVITVLIGLLLLLTFAPALYAATYYVDATLGIDTNDGLSQTAAWKTIAKVNASRFNPGDQILFKRGGWTCRETVIEPSFGSSANDFTDFVLEWKSVKG